MVLATGILPPRWPRDLGTLQDNERCVSDPWEPGVLDQVGPADTVTLLGTGLTAVDVLLALAEKGHHGSIRAISRHGLLPRAHLSGPQPSATTGNAPLGLGSLDVGSLEVGDRRTRLLLHRFRDTVAEQEARGGDWRAIVELLRPRTQELWQSLPPEEQLRFRRHVERFWNVHRHRMAPAVAEQVDQLRDAGTFRSLAGRILALRPFQTGLELQVKLPSNQRPYRWETDWLVNCTGPGTFAFTDDRIFAQNLRKRGLARPGHLGTGIDTDAGGRVIAASGRPSEWMWALGSLRQGQLLESTAVPEIRAQAQEIATAISGYLAGKASRRARPMTTTGAIATAVPCTSPSHLRSQRYISPPRTATSPPPVLAMAGIGGGQSHRTATVQLTEPVEGYDKHGLRWQDDPGQCRLLT